MSDGSSKGAAGPIYTRAGDEGLTRLLGGARVSKASPQVEAYGTVDELITFVGLAAAMAGEPDGAWPEAGEILTGFQEALMKVAAGVAAADPKARKTLARIPDDAVSALERDIDAMTGEMPELDAFILPGGTRLAAALHVCRTVCRRAERRLTELAVAHPEAVPPEAGPFVNRLGDWFFTAARYANLKANVADLKWSTGRR